MKYIIFIFIFSFLAHGQFVDLPSSSTASLDSIGDVDITAASDSDYLIYNSATSKWENKQATISNLPDFNVTSPQDNDFFLYDSATSKWINSLVGINLLSDVGITSATGSEYLIYNGVSGEWENKVPQIDNMGDVEITTAAATDFLIYNDSSAKWENKQAILDNISDVSLTSATDSDFLLYNQTTSKWENSSKFSDYVQAYTGMSEERQDVVIVESGGSLYYQVEKIGGGDINYIYGKDIATLNCTTVTDSEGLGNNKARVLLTAGTATSPQKNYIYVTRSGSVASLSSSTTIPTGEFSFVGVAVVPDATTFTTTGAYSHQRTSESLLVNERGLWANEREKLRALGAEYESGVSQTLTITTNGGSPDNVIFNSTLGSIYQLHRQDFPAFTGTPTLYVANDSATPFKAVTDLNELLTDANGDSMSGRRFNLVIWGAVNKTLGECKLFVNLPTGTYGTNSSALADVDGTAVTSIPSDFKGVGFLIARLSFRHRTLNSGTWTNLSGDSSVVDLRGLKPGFNIGSGGSSKNEFVDTNFRVYDDADTSKKVSLEVDGVTTGTTRELTVPDADGTITINTIDNNFTASQTLAGFYASGRGTIGQNVTEATVNGTGYFARLNTWCDNDSTCANAGLGYAHDTVATMGPTIFGGRSRGTLASKSIVQSGDNLFDIIALGWDGTDYAISSRIDMESDGTPGTDDMPGRIVLKTSPDGTQVPTEALRLDSTNKATFQGLISSENGVIEIAETTSPSCTSDYGCIHTASDNLLYFTDGAGVEKVIATGAGAGVIPELLEDGSFETDISEVTCTTGTCTNDTTTFLYGSRSLKIALSAQTADVSIVKTNAGTLEKQMQASCDIKSSSSLISLCAIVDSVEIDCNTYSGSDNWENVQALFSGAITAQGIKIKTSGAETDDIYVDNCSVSSLDQLTNVATASTSAYSGYVSQSNCKPSLGTSADASFSQITDADCTAMTDLTGSSWDLVSGELSWTGYLSEGKYLVNINPSVYVNTSNYAAISLQAYFCSGNTGCANTDTEVGSIVGYQKQSGTSPQQAQMLDVSGIINVTSSGIKSISLMKKLVTASSVNSSLLYAEGYYASLGFSITPVETTASLNLQNMVTIPNSGNKRRGECIVRFAGATEGVNCDSTCSIYTNMGSCATSVSRSSTGTYVLNWDSSIWASKPVCFGGSENGNVPIYPDNTNGTALSITMYSYLTSTGGLNDTRGAVRCVGDLK